MKKFLKWLAYGFAGLFVLFLAIGILMKTTGLDKTLHDDATYRVRRTEAKLTATMIYTDMIMHQLEHNKYPNPDGFKKMVETQTSGAYKAGTIETDENVKAICPDCRISDGSFKIAIYGNIDKDDELDVVTINDKKEMMLIRDDSGEHSSPVDIAPKGAN